MRIIKELYETEISYINSLNLLIKSYEEPLKSIVSTLGSKSILKMQQIDCLFNEIKMIITINKKFLLYFNGRLNSPVISIGDIFISLVYFF